MQSIGVSPKRNRVTGSGSPRRIAVIGAGISGLVSAYRLSRGCEVTLYEACPVLGGHSHTIDLDWEGRGLRVETGFVVFNRQTYPRFDRLLTELGVASQASDMSFSVRCETDGLEYCGTNLNTVFAQRSNSLQPRFLRMLAAIARFNRMAAADLTAGTVAGSLGDYLAERGLRGDLVDRYLVPMGAAIWSAPPAGLLRYPAANFLGFLENHRLLRVGNQLAWRTLVGGCRSYLVPLTRPLVGRIRTNAAVRALVRTELGVTVCTDHDVQTFDEVVVATHADRALAMLDEPTSAERDVLGAFCFQGNDVVVHSDESLMPRSTRARASWNYTIPRGSGTATMEPVIVTYDMSRLQRLPTRRPIYVSLNASHRIDPAKVLTHKRFDHPQFDARTLQAQARHAEISGKSGIHYCGAYWGNGFHEDGVVSAERVIRMIRLESSEAQTHG